MHDSIALPIAELAGTVNAPPRCFVLFKTGAREIAAFPFQKSVLTELGKAYEHMRAEGEWDGEFFCTLFFPEEWPPALIDDFLNSKAYQPSLWD